MRQSTITAVVLLCIFTVAIPMTLAKMGKAREIRNTPAITVTVATKSETTVRSGKKDFPVFWVSWPEPVGTPTEATVPKELWSQLKQGDKVQVGVTSDGKAHLKGGNDDSLETEYGFLSGECTGLTVCGAILLYRHKTFVAKVRLVAAQRGPRDPMLPLSYRQIAAHFRVDGAYWVGAVIASADAIYLLKGEREKVGAGLIGLLITAAIQKEELSQSCTYKQLPQAVREDPDWPIIDDLDCPVLIIPRADVNGIYHPWFSNVLELDLAGRRIRVVYGWFSGGSIRAFLDETGWPNARSALARRRIPLALLGLDMLAITFIVGGGVCLWMPQFFNNHRNLEPVVAIGILAGMGIGVLAIALHWRRA